MVLETKSIFRVSDLFESFIEFSHWIASMGHRVRVLHTDAEAVFIHGAIAQYLAQSKVSTSHPWPYLKETNGQAERCIGNIMDMTRSFLKTAKMHQKYWSLVVGHAPYIQNRVPSAVFGGRTPCETTYGVLPNIAHGRICGSEISAWISLESWKSKLSAKA